MNFKIGNSVKRTSGGSYPTYGLIVGDTYIIEGVVEYEDGVWLALKGVLGVGNDPHQWDAECFELVKEEKDVNTFDIKDLKTGQRVTTSDGSEYIAITNSSHTLYNSTVSLHYKIGTSCYWKPIETLEKEIVKVEDPDNIQKVLCNYWGEGGRSTIIWTTVWEAPAKETPEQIKQRELMEKYEAVKKEFEELGKQIGVGQ